MPYQTFFVQDCPICGRRVRVSVEYLGKAVKCQNCRAIFVARDPEQEATCSDSSVALLRRVDELLANPPEENAPAVH